MNAFDAIIILMYLLGLIIFGAWMARRQHDCNEYFLAGRSMGWLPVGLSVMATAFSAINYMAFAGEVARNGSYVLLSLPIFLLVALPITRIFIPFYNRLSLCSVYEYLEQRFDVRVRLLASILFMIWRLFWMAAALYVPSRVLHGITGWNLQLLIIAVGGIALFYTTMGGMRAVMWTDVIQFFVLFGGLVIAVGWTVSRHSGSFAGLWELSVRDGLLKPFYPFDTTVLSLDPTIRISLWSCWIGTFVAFLSRYGADQVVVQRYFTASSEQTARRGFWLNSVAAFFSLLCLAVLGLALHAHIVGNNLDPALPPIAHFAHFIKKLPYGFSGLITAGLIAATMSSIDSGINSCSTAYLVDVHWRFFSEAPEQRSAGRNLASARIAVLFFGIAATAMALLVGHLGTVFEVANRIITAFGSPLLALFLLGMYSRSVTSRGVFWGGLLGALWSGWTGFSAARLDLALHYFAVVNLLGTLLLCYVCSWLHQMLNVKHMKPDKKHDGLAK